MVSSQPFNGNQMGSFMKLYQILVVCLCVFSQGVAEEPCLYLTSQEDVAERFIERVQEEKERICLASHKLTHVGIVNALIEAHRRNVLVEVIVDSASVFKSSPIHRLIKEGIFVCVLQSPSLPVPLPPRYPGIPPGVAKPTPRFQKRMNHTFCVFGSDLSWTGSYAFIAKSKFAHFENALLLKDEKIAKEFLEEFDRMKKKHVIYLPLYLQQKEVSS